jgi:hypothetical protein
MSLQIRRGTDGQRSAVVFDLGEIVYTTDKSQLWVGDGTTAGGKNILANAAGAGLSWNATTQALDFTGQNLSLTTDIVNEGTVNKYFTTSRAQAAAAAMFTATGSPAETGSITATTSGTPSLVTVSSATGLAPLEPFVVAGNSGNTGGLSNGTYYVVTVNTGTNQVTLATSLANAQAGTTINSLTTNNSFTGVTFTAGGPDSNITFVYNATNGTIAANVNLNASGILSVSQDTSPLLGGNLGLNSHNIVGTGNINISGTITTASTLTASTGLGANLPLNTYSITGTGGISITGDINNTGNITASNTVQASSAKFDAVAPTSSQTTFTVNAGLNGVFIKGLQSSGNAQGAVLTAYQSRGTLASPTAVSSGDFLSGIATLAHNGTSYVFSGNFGIVQDPAFSFTSSSPSVPTGFVVTVPDNNNNSSTFTFNSKGVLNTPVILTTVYSAAGTPIPSASSVGMGARAFVSDATANTFNTAYTSGGSYKMPVFSNGTSWYIG